MPITPEKMAEMSDLAADVMKPVLKVAARRLVQSMEEIHDSEIKPLRTVLRKLVDAARTSGGVAGRDEALCVACDEAEAVLSG